MLVALRFRELGLVSRDRECNLQLPSARPVTGYATTCECTPEPRSGVGADGSIFQKLFVKLFRILWQIFFGRRRLKKRSEKTENARSKRKHRKGRGQAAAKKRSPLLRMWKRDRARSAKVHACGAQMNRELGISRNFERVRGMS